MKKMLFLSFFMLLVCSAFGKNDTIPVLTLGVFHFNFPNLDKIQTSEEDQIDVLEPEYQEEINVLVNMLAKFKPTIIVIERHPQMQSKIDSLYHQYLLGKYNLNRSEEQQIGFRLAKKMNIEKLYCVDTWGKSYESIDRLLDSETSGEYIAFETSFDEHPDSLKSFELESVFKKEGIIKELFQLNDKGNIKNSLGNYLIGHFKYESEPYDYTGVDFESGRWFNRNLRIFRNIQRIATKDNDKILVIFGSGHLNILNYLFECSPEYKLEDTSRYLEMKSN